MFHILIGLNQYFIMQVFNIDIDLITAFRCKCKSASSADLNPIEHFWSTNITEDLKHFQYAEFNTRLKLIKSNLLKFI